MYFFIIQLIIGIIIQLIVEGTFYGTIVVYIYFIVGWVASDLIFNYKDFEKWKLNLIKM